MASDVAIAREVFEEMKEKLYEMWGKHSEQEAIDMIYRCGEIIKKQIDPSCELQVMAMDFITVLIGECHKYFRKGGR